MLYNIFYICDIFLQQVKSGAALVMMTDDPLSRRPSVYGCSICMTIQIINTDREGGKIPKEVAFERTLHRLQLHPLWCHFQIHPLQLHTLSHQQAAVIWWHTVEVTAGLRPWAWMSVDYKHRTPLPMEVRVPRLTIEDLTIIGNIICWDIQKILNIISTGWNGSSYIKFKGTRQ